MVACEKAAGASMFHNWDVCANIPTTHIHYRKPATIPLDESCHAAFDALVSNMTYSANAIALRRCTGTTKQGQPCRAWAVWDDPRQLCAIHAGRGHRGPRPNTPAWQAPGYGRTRNPNCTCAAYQWPHRPGGGLCRWPDPPEMICTTPSSTHVPRTKFGQILREHGRLRGLRIR